MTKKVALVTGVNGQDGSYLCEHLLKKGYEVHGVMRRASTITTERIDHIFDPLGREYIHYGNLNAGIDSIVYQVRPDVVYNLGAMSHVWVSFKEPVYSAMANSVGVVKLLETIRQAEQSLGKQIRFYQASSSEMFGKTPPPHNEESYFHPASPYGCAKLYSYWITRTYRDSYNMFAANGILFNHESPRRGKTFVTKKITRAAARIANGLQDTLELGNLDSLRDWGHSKDYTRAMMMIMEHTHPDDFVVSTGEAHSVREFVDKVFAHFNLDVNKHLVVLDELKRPNEVPALLGTSDKIRKELGWVPEYSFDMLVKEMCEMDDAEAKRDALIK